MVGLKLSLESLKAVYSRQILNRACRNYAIDCLSSNYWVQTDGTDGNRMLKQTWTAAIGKSKAIRHMEPEPIMACIYEQQNE